VWRNHRRAAKKRAGAIKYARDRPTLAYADQAATQLWQASDPIAAALWQAEFRHYRPLIKRIVAQTESSSSWRRDRRFSTQGKAFFSSIHVHGSLPFTMRISRSAIACSAL
jgi:hypothetical protein